MSGPSVEIDDDAGGFFDEPCEEPGASDHQHDVAFIENFFEHIGAGDDAAWHFSTILQTVERAALSRRSLQLNEFQKDRLLSALTRATNTAWHTLPPHYHRGQLVAGVHACWQAILHWAQPDAQRHATGGYVTDIRDCMRIFRNQAHNLALIDQITERARDRHDRRVSIFKSLKAPSAADIAALAEHDLALVLPQTATSEGAFSWR